MTFHATLMEKTSDKVWKDIFLNISERYGLWSSTFDFYFGVSEKLEEEFQKSKKDGAGLLSGTTTLTNDTETKLGREFIDNQIALEYHLYDEGETVMFGGGSPRLVVYNVNKIINGFPVRLDKTAIFRTIREFYTNVFCDFQGTFPSEYANEPIVEKCRNVFETVRSQELPSKLYDLANSETEMGLDLYKFECIKQIVKLPVYCDATEIRDYLDEHESSDRLTKYVTDIYWDFLYNISRIGIEFIWLFYENFSLSIFPWQRDLNGLIGFENV